MWLPKWFGGGRNEVEQTDEPARFTAPDLTRSPQSATTTARKAQAAGSPKGFDPYNSGAFKSRNAWERVSRR
jgi:hypothetical protein